MQKGLPVYWKPLSLWNREYLACALAMEALKQYITVKYVRMADFLLECTVAWDEKRYDKVLQAYARPKLFIIDEWLDIELTKNDLHAIKELVHRRRRKLSTIFCSQILKEGWYQALGGENTEAEAIIDRITYDGYDINIEYTDPANAVSMRKIYSKMCLLYDGFFSFAVVRQVDNKLFFFLRIIIKFKYYTNIRGNVTFDRKTS